MGSSTWSVPDPVTSGASWLDLSAVRSCKMGSAQTEMATTLAQTFESATLFKASASPPTDANKLVADAAPIMKGLYFNNGRATKRREREKWIADAAQYTLPARRTPEGLVAEKEEKERCLERLKTLLKGDRLALAIVQATLDGHETAADKMKVLGEDERAIRNARKRVDRAVRAIADAKDEGTAPEWTVDDGVSAPAEHVEESESGQEVEEQE